MLHKVGDLRVEDLYFDDDDWSVRYLVVRRTYIVPTAAGGRERAGAGGASLRSSADVIGCDIEATDGTVGSVADLVVDDETWSITDVLVDSRTWLPGRILLISPAAIERIDWEAKTLHLGIARQDILQAPQISL